MSKAISKSFVLRREGPSTKKVGKVQQGCLARGETEACKVMIGLYIFIHTQW
jgi:hypothetical protein